MASCSISKFFTSCEPKLVKLSTACVNRRSNLWLASSRRCWVFASFLCAVCALLLASGPWFVWLTTWNGCIPCSLASWGAIALALWPERAVWNRVKFLVARPIWVFNSLFLHSEFVILLSIGCQNLLFRQPARPEVGVSTPLHIFIYYSLLPVELRTCSQIEFAAWLDDNFCQNFFYKQRTVLASRTVIYIIEIN